MRERFKPVNSLNNPRFCGIRTFMRLPYKKTEEVDFLMIGVPFDTGVSFRVGSRFGPQAIREASVRLRQYHPRLEVDIFEHLSGVDYGDIEIVPGNTTRSHEKIKEALLPLLEEGCVPLLMGGDHSITLPELRAIKEIHGPVALIQFDAHHDTWDSLYGEKYSHASPIIRSLEEGLIQPEKSILVGMRGTMYSREEMEETEKLGLEMIPADSIFADGLRETIKRIRERVGREKVFFTFDIDMVDPVYAPGTGTPEIGGLTSRETLELVEGLKGLNFIGFDLVEVLPTFDVSEITSLLAATLLNDFLALLACKRIER